MYSAVCHLHQWCTKLLNVPERMDKVITNCNRTSNKKNACTQDIWWKLLELVTWWSLQGVVECHHITADTVVTGQRADAATEDLRTANLNGYRARGQASTVVRHKLHCWNTVYGGNCCHISICTWPFVRSSPTGPSFKNCGLSFAPLSSNCFMESGWISFDWFKTRFPAAHLKRAIRGFRHGSAWRASTSRLTVGANGSTNRTWPSNLSCHPSLPS